MHKLYVVFPNGQGFTRDFSTFEAVLDHLREYTEDTPTTVNILELDEDVALPQEPLEVQFGQSRIGDSSISGTKVVD